MAIELKSLVFYEQANRTITKNMESVLTFKNQSQPSTVPTSDFQQAIAQMTRLFDMHDQNIINGLKSIDQQILNGNLIKEINDLADEAKKEAERLRTAVKTITKIKEAIDSIAEVVTKIGTLPFI